MSAPIVPLLSTSTASRVGKHPTGTQQPTLQVIAHGALTPKRPKRSGRRRQRRHALMPEIQRRIAGVYISTGYDSERTANDLCVSRLDVIDGYLQWLARERMGRAA